MALFVMDEWVWADAAGENGENRQRETIKLMLAIYKICDRLIIVRGSAFERKAVNFWSRTDTTRWEFAKFFKDFFLYNSDKSEFIDHVNLPNLPVNLESDIQPEDRYLAQAHLAYPASRVITTDVGLKTALSRHGFPCEHRDNFIPQYLASH